MSKLISVIIPVYKVEKYLDKCIESVVNQTYKNLEIILVDDGSPDKCPEKCDNWAKRDDRIKVIHKQNGGVSSARNIGIKVSKGEYISFIDSDDYIHKDFFAELVGKAEENYSDIVFCRYFKVMDGQPIQEYEELEDFVENKNFRLLVTDKGKVNAYLCRCLFKKILFNNINYDESLKYLEDLYLLLNLLKAKPKLDYVNIPLYYYFIHQNSLCNNINENYCYLFKNGAIKCSQELILMGLKEESKSLLYNIYLIALKQAILLRNKKIIEEFDKIYNNISNYKAFKECNKTLKSKVKAFCARHKLIKIYKFLLKLNS